MRYSIADTTGLFWCCKLLPCYTAFDEAEQGAHVHAVGAGLF